MARGYKPSERKLKICNLFCDHLDEIDYGVWDGQDRAGALVFGLAVHFGSDF